MFPKSTSFLIAISVVALPDQSPGGDEITFSIANEKDLFEGTEGNYTNETRLACDFADANNFSELVKQPSRARLSEILRGNSQFEKPSEEPGILRFEGDSIRPTEGCPSTEKVCSFSDTEVIDQGQSAPMRNKCAGSLPSLSTKSVCGESSLRDMNHTAFSLEITRALLKADGYGRVPLLRIGEQSTVPQFRREAGSYSSKLIERKSLQSHLSGDELDQACRSVNADEYAEERSSVLAEINRSGRLHSEPGTEIRRTSRSLFTH